MLSTVKPVDTKKRQLVSPSELLVEQGVVAEKNIVYIIGHTGINTEDVKTGVSVLNTGKTTGVPFHQKAMKEDFARAPRKVSYKKTFFNSSFIGAINTRSRGRS